jgi:dihydroorotate dehydrogenase electron transfer subunit
MKRDELLMVRLFSTELISTAPVSSDASLLTVHASALAQAAQPGQYCMVRCCSPQAYDPLLRRPFFIHSVDRAAGLCTFLVSMRGRGSRWLISQPAGVQLELLGPSGHGWSLPATARNLLLVAEEGQIASLTFLAQEALLQEIAVTIVYQCHEVEKAYPPALLAPEVEYHIVTDTDRAMFVANIASYLTWADAICCSVSRETALALYSIISSRYDWVRSKHFAQATAEGHLICGTGLCLLCDVETSSGLRLLCHEGPVFGLRELVR